MQARHCDGGTNTAVTSSKFPNQCFNDVPDDIKSYIRKHIIHLLRLNVGQTTSVRRLIMC